MMRYFFEVSYKGTNFHGWQTQNNAVTVQEEIEKAFKLILQEDTAITGSGRTDTGVHCEQQFFHTDLTVKIDEGHFLRSLNNLLSPDIAIRSMKKVKPDAHARYDAIERSYVYRIIRFKNPFFQDTAYFYGKNLDMSTMNDAASLLLGKQDFKSFSKVKTDVNNFDCEIIRAEWVEEDDLYIFNISANRFLRGMVRAIVGTLMEVGKGRMAVEGFKAVIKAKDRKVAGASAPAQGLFLSRVRYPSDIFINHQ